MDGCLIFFTLLIYSLLLNIDNVTNVRLPSSFNIMETCAHREGELALPRNPVQGEGQQPGPLPSESPGILWLAGGRDCHSVYYNSSCTVVGVRHHASSISLTLPGLI